ncbi:hypothetical protein V1477_016034 [Vespula maculifrons]|uniref:Uncharacterized protein n=1 Tax=Vespula maculifrons TaxID=7453 RepID=A0ABD2BBW3_VESMC
MFLSFPEFYLLQRFCYTTRKIFDNFFVYIRLRITAFFSSLFFLFFFVIFNFLTWTDFFSFVCTIVARK